MGWTLVVQRRVFAPDPPFLFNYANRRRHTPWQAPTLHPTGPLDVEETVPVVPIVPTRVQTGSD